MGVWDTSGMSGRSVCGLPWVSFVALALTSCSAYSLHERSNVFGLRLKPHTFLSTYRTSVLLTPSFISSTCRRLYRGLQLKTSESPRQHGVQSSLSGTWAVF